MDSTDLHTGLRGRRETMNRPAHQRGWLTGDAPSIVAMKHSVYTSLALIIS